MAKRKQLDFRTATTDELKAHLKKQKAQEALLELALSLREHPELEDMLTRIITCVAELRVTEKHIRLEDVVGVDAEEVAVQKQALETQISKLDTRLISLESKTDSSSIRLKEMYAKSKEDAQAKLPLVGLSKKMLKLKEHYDKIHTELLELISVWSNDEVLNAFSLEDQIPGVTKYVEGT